VDDGAAIWELVRDAGSLDLNSPYAYLLFSECFPESCAVAHDGDALAGAIVGFCPPQRPDSLFVWQVAVSPRFRGRGLGTQVLAWLMDHAAERGVEFLEATVTPDNEASLRLFRGFAHEVGAECVESMMFPSDLFPEAGERHEEEWLFRIGPVRRSSLQPLIEERVGATGGLPQ
jgi:L-2,4-diaminobutyric acid acetyltransferase